MSNNNFRYQPFVALSGNLGGKVPIVDDVLSSHEQEIYQTTSLDENCIEFEFQTDRNYYVDLRQSFLALKLNFVKGRGYELYFADSLGCKKYSFLKQHYKQMMPATLQSHPSVCGFYTIYAAFHLFKFQQEEITVHDVNLLSFISNYM